MRLQDSLDQRKTNFESSASEEVVATMHRATDALIDSDILSKVPKKGQIVPSLTLPGPDGTRFSSQALLEKGPLVIHFFRGGWCPYCCLELDALSALNSDINNLGATLVAISPNTVNFAAETMEKMNLTFPILSDAGCETAARFGLAFKMPADLIELYKKFDIDLETINGNADWELPMPARFIVDRTGTIVDARVNADYTKRPEPLEIIDILKQITA